MNHTVPRLSALTLAVALAWLGMAHGPATRRTPPSPPATVSSADDLDQVLQETAKRALGQRRGAIVVMDPQSGRIRAVVNPELAFAEATPPGSTIKPFVALTALRDRTIDTDSTTSCRTPYIYKDFHTACSHSRNLPPLRLAEALAYSCNYYFGTLGERVSERALTSTLAAFGFARRTGVNFANEAQGRLLADRWNARNALGEGQYLQTTPLQLLTAYDALVNGGRLMTPQLARDTGFQPLQRGSVEINSHARAAILEGMRGAVRYGTARSAGLDDLPLYTFGKTGTATAEDGYHTHGWFVGFASDPHAEDPKQPGSAALAVLVFLERGRGVEAAKLARAVFAAFIDSGSKSGLLSAAEPTNISAQEFVAWSTLPSSGPAESSSATPVAAFARADPTLRKPPPLVRVRADGRLAEVPFEDYVLGVVAAEGSLEANPEALKALAVVVRTYALRNLGRHRAEGFDFCTLTHCERYRPLDNQAARRAVRPSILAAVRETRGQLLRDDRGNVIDAYFSASCGGNTADIKTLWGVKGESYLAGVPDEYCATMPHYRWTDRIRNADLLRALQSDPRSDVGGRIDQIAITRYDHTGRAESISLTGEWTRTIAGWELKLIVGRALGWNLLKSSRFTVRRAGDDFVFTGGGFGHGLGLCQEGAHVMAERGAGYTRILAKYFPGARVARG
jgi:SpoIID/LytB domain protein